MSHVAIYMQLLVEPQKRHEVQPLAWCSSKKAGLYDNYTLQHIQKTLTGTLSGCFSLIFEASVERTSGEERSSTSMYSNLYCY